MARGIVRKIDELGRICIPMEYRKAFGVTPRENAPAVMHLVGNVMRVELKPEKAIGLTRFLDELGRLTLPIEIRRSLGFEECQEVDMYIESNEICFRKAVTGCIICGSTDQLLEVEGIHICRSCGLKIVDKVMEA